MKKILSIVLALVMIVALAACGQQTTTAAETTTEAPAAEAEAPAAEEVVAEEPAAEPVAIKIGATGLLEDQFTQVLINGYKQAAEDLGIEIIAVNSQYSLATETEQINNMIAAGCQGVIIECVDPDSTAGIAETAAEAGLAVFACARGLNTDVCFASCLNDCYDLGTSVGGYAKEYFAENFTTDQEIKVAVIAYDSTDATGSAGRVDGFMDQLADYNINVVARKDGTSFENSIQAAQDILTANPDIDVIYAASETGIVGAVQSIEALGEDCHAVVFGVDCSEQIVEMLKADNNILQAVVAQDPWTQAIYSVNTMYQYLLDGTTPEQEVFQAEGTLMTRADTSVADTWLTNWVERSQA